MYQMKEQDNIPEEGLREVEICNNSDIDYRVMIIRMLKELESRMNGMRKKFLTKS